MKVLWTVLALLPVVASLLRGSNQSRVASKIGLLSAHVFVDVVVLSSSMDQAWYWWMAPFFLGWYLLARRFIITDPR